MTKSSKHFKEPCVILVWIGAELPSYAIRSIDFFLEHNNIPVHLILVDYEADGTTLAHYGNRLRINRFDSSSLSFKRPRGMLSHPLIIKASMRLLILRNFAVSNGIETFFHFEFDNVVSNIDLLASRLNTFGEGLFVVRDSYERALASFLYCNNIKPLLEIEQYFDEDSSNLTEMHILGYMCRVRSDVFSLPTESYLENSKHWEIVPPMLTGGIFDASSMGMYLYGIDPVLLRFSPIINMARHHNSKINWRNTCFFQKENTIFIKVGTLNSLKIFNIHVHSKQLKVAIRSQTSSKSLIIFLLNKNIPMLISCANSYRYALSKLRLLLSQIFHC